MKIYKVEIFNEKKLIKKLKKEMLKTVKPLERYSVQLAGYLVYFILVWFGLVWLT